MSHLHPSAPAAAGAVLWRPAEGKSSSNSVEVALIHRPRYDDWSFPKGKLDPGETALQAAVREVLEEAGSHVAVQQHLTTVTYSTNEGVKNVDYWSMRHVSGSFHGRHETDQMRWFSIDKAYDRLTYDIDCKVLEQFETAEIPDCVLLLVRHVKAGKRDQWKGPDLLRPLEQEGQLQAERLVEFARYFQPKYLAAAPPLRCIQSLEPLSKALQLPVKTAEWLSDEAWFDDPHTAYKSLLHRVRKGKTSVLCSQGDAIPMMLAELGAAALATDLATAKGAAWLLCFKGEKLVALDRYPYPAEISLPAS